MRGRVPEVPRAPGWGFGVPPWGNGAWAGKGGGEGWCPGRGEEGDPVRQGGGPVSGGRGRYPRGAVSGSGDGRGAGVPEGWCPRVGVRCPGSGLVTRDEGCEGRREGAVSQDGVAGGGTGSGGLGSQRASGAAFQRLEPPKPPGNRMHPLLWASRPPPTLQGAGGAEEGGRPPGSPRNLPPDPTPPGSSGGCARGEGRGGPSKAASDWLNLPATRAVFTSAVRGAEPPARGPPTPEAIKGRKKPRPRP